ncbi:MAG: IMP cyclohydrolase [Oscillospiraceae bacterium]|nr:IMP cyclohydrolase [Oscillospiraceae bacterium]
MIKNIDELLSNNPYPGRGIIVGCSEDGKKSIVVYFIMGRSENSRNRVFEKTTDGIRTAAYDPNKLVDPSLIIYNPVRITNQYVIVTNGDQTDTILNSINNDSDFYSALQTREYEPDAPNFTPRISGIVKNDGSYDLSILKTMSNNPAGCQRNFYKYSTAIPGLGHFISTYETDGDPLPSFKGEPIPIHINYSHGLEAFALTVWNALDVANKVSLYAQESNIESGDINGMIINRHNISEKP